MRRKLKHGRTEASSCGVFHVAAACRLPSEPCNPRVSPAAAATWVHGIMTGRAAYESTASLDRGELDTVLKCWTGLGFLAALLCLSACRMAPPAPQPSSL